MDLPAARDEALALMRAHGLQGWRLVWDNAKTRAGVCNESTRQIGLSRVLTGLHTPDEVRDTILHEIAHALVGVQHGHDKVWRAKALQLGCSGIRCVSGSSAEPRGPWRGTCPKGHEFQGYRSPQRVTSCRHCCKGFDLGSIIVWRWHGRVVPMSRRYQSELASLTHAAAESAAAHTPLQRRPLAEQLELEL